MNVSGIIVVGRKVEKEAEEEEEKNTEQNIVCRLEAFLGKNPVVVFAMALAMESQRERSDAENKKQRVAWSGRKEASL